MSPPKCRKMSAGLWFAVVCLLLLHVAIAAIAAPDENGPLSEVQTAVGFEVSLPCDLIPASSTPISALQDKVTLVIWYKEGNTKPIYTLDARGKPLQQAVHWADQEVFTTKAHFYYDSFPPSLRIKSIKREDAGLYRCRVDFQKSPTRNWRINLSVLVPPTQLVILDHMGATHTEGAIGPYREGTAINITCLSSGGVPAPRVSWWREHALLDDSFDVLPDGSVRNVLHVPKLSRADLLTVYTCQASNGHVVPPLSSTVKLDMRLPPLFVRLQGLNHPLVSGVRTQATCTSAGARPSPQIVWNKGGILMRGATQTTSADGNSTVSELIFLPVPEDNGKLVTCSVTTDKVIGVGPGVFLKDSRPLDVKHAPIVALSLGAPLDPNNLMKGSDVYLECDIKANPPVKRVEWYHNDRQLFSSRGIIITNQTLVLQGIAKATHGQYMCRATNPQGTVGSNEVYLDVKYPPVCLVESTVIKAAIKQTVNVSCGIDSNPALNLTFKWTFNNTLENLTDLPAIEAHSSAPETSADDETNNNSNNHIAYPESLVYSGNQHQAGNNIGHSPRNRYQTATAQHANLAGTANDGNSGLASSRSALRPVLPNNVYPYRVTSFQHFGTISCIAHNAIGQSAPCLYHIVAAEVPEPVRNCSAANATANAVHIACEPGKDGGIQQHFHVQVWDEQSQQVLYNITFRQPVFVVKRLPSDTVFRLLVTSFNAQGAAAAGVRMRVRTLPAPLLRTASSTAVLVELTPLVGALLGVGVTLILVAICIIIFVKVRGKRPSGSGNDNAATEPDKGSAEPLSRNMGSHSSIEDKNPDVVPHVANSDDDDDDDHGDHDDEDDVYASEEKAFDRLTNTTNTTNSTSSTANGLHRILYTPSHLNTAPVAHPPQSLSIGDPFPPGIHPQQQQQQLPPQRHSNQFGGASAFASHNTGAKPYGELSLTTNPAYALYNSPHRRPPPLYSAPKQLTASPTQTTTSTSPTAANIYTRVPTRPFVPYDSRLSPTAYAGTGFGGLHLDQQQQQQQQQLHQQSGAGAAVARGLSPTYETRISPIYDRTGGGGAQMPPPLLLHQQNYHLAAQQLQGSASTLAAASSTGTGGSQSGDDLMHYQHVRS